MQRLAAIVLAVVAAMVPAVAAPAAGFNEIVKRVEDRLDVKMVNPRSPSLLVRGVMAFHRSSAPGGFKIAVIGQRGATASGSEFQAAVAEAVGSGWEPVLQVWSERRRTHVTVHLRPSGGKWEALIATSGSGEAALVGFKVPGRQFLEWFRDKESMIEGLSTAIQ